MRVLHILPDREDGRAESHAAGVILGLQKANIEQCVILERCSPYAAPFERAGIKVLPRPFHAPGWPLRRLWLAGWVARMRPDIAHCWARSAARLAPPGKMPVVGWLAGYDDSRHLTRCTHIISASRASARRFAKRAGVPARFIPAFPEFSQAPPLDRRRLATPGDAKVLVSLAPLDSVGRIDSLLAALRHLPDCVLWLGGQTLSRAAIEKSAADCGVIDRIRFAAPKTDSFALLRAADLCIMTMADRSFDALVSKAWAAGTPVVASRRAGFYAPLENGVTGLLTPNGDEMALAGAVRRILDEGALRSQLIAKGYAVWLGTYAREAVMRQWVEFYKGIGGQHSGIRD